MSGALFASVVLKQSDDRTRHKYLLPKTNPAPVLVKHGTEQRGKGIPMEEEEQTVPNELNLGISELDDQHQAFFLHMVGLRRALTDGMGGRDKLMKTLRFLEEWVNDHFQAEERIMRTHNYPGILVHRLEHEKFAKVVAEFSKKAYDLDARGEVTSFLAVEIEHKFENWLVEHIKKMDAKMAEFVKGRS